MARWMDPATGTFLSVDPVVSNYADPQTLNAYAYARNNPVTNTDPTGACIMSDCGYWYGQLPAGMSPSQAANGAGAQFANPGYLADSGAAAGMFVSDFVSGSSPPSFSSFVGSVFDSVASIGSLFSSGVGSDDFSFAEGEGIPTDLIDSYTGPGGIETLVYTPEDFAVIDHQIANFEQQVGPMIRTMATLYHIEEAIAVPLLITGTGLAILGVGAFALATAPVSVPVALLAGGILGVTGVGVTAVGLDLGATQANESFGTSLPTTGRLPPLLRRH